MSKKDTVYKSTEEKGLFLPDIVVDRLIGQIENGTLVDDHETLGVITLRTKSVLQGKYIWHGDPYFTRLADRVFAFWRYPSYQQKYKTYTPEFVFSMGRLLVCVQLLCTFLDEEEQS